MASSLNPPRVVREGVWIALSQVSVIGGAFVGVRILTTLLTPEVYGPFNLLLTFGLLCIATLCHPFLQALLRFYPDALLANRVGALVRMTWGLLIRGLGVVAIFLVLVGGALHVTRGTAFFVFLAAAVYLGAETYRNHQSNLLNADRRQRDFALRTIFDAWAKPLLAVSAVLMIGPTSFSVFAGYAVASILGSLAFITRSVRGHASEDREASDAWIERTRPAFLKFAKPLIPQAVLSNILYVGDRYVLDIFWGHATVGIYSAGYGLASYPFIGGNALLISTLRPILYDAVARGDTKKERRTLWTWIALIAAMMAAGVGVLLVFGRALCQFCLGPRFQSAAEILPWVGAAYGVFSLQQCAETVLLAHGATRRMIVLQATGAGAGLVFYFLLIPRFGAMGAALASLLSMVVTCAVAIPLANLPGRLRGPNPQAPR